MQRKRKTAIALALVAVFAAIFACCLFQQEARPAEPEMTDELFRAVLDAAATLSAMRSSEITPGQWQSIQAITTGEAFNAMANCYAALYAVPDSSFIPLDTYIGESLPDDEIDARIVKKDGGCGIYRKDLYFIGGSAYVKIGPAYIELKEKDYPESIEEMRGNPSYRFSLSSYAYYDNGLFFASFVSMQPDQLGEASHEPYTADGGARASAGMQFREYALEMDMVVTNGQISEYRQRLKE